MLPTHERVLQAVEQYFLSGVVDPSAKVCRTSLPPLYFQHPGMVGIWVCYTTVNLKLFRAFLDNCRIRKAEKRQL